jgi:osmotically-inducible protein OsmY
MLGKLLFGAAAGGAAAWFLKNNEAAKAQASRYAGQLKGAAGGVTGAGRESAEERLNDPALARKVESEIFRDSEIPKGDISVNAEYGVIYLRGQVSDREAMEQLVARAREVDGVRGVENLTHLPSEPAPTKSS